MSLLIAEAEAAGAAGNLASVAVSKGEHQVLTNAWRNEIPYAANATPAQIRGAASQVYADSPVIPSALGLP